MPATLAYPATTHTPPPLIDLSDRAERERISGDAMKAFFNIMACWKVADSDAMRLLGDISNGAFYAAKKAPGKRLEEDRLRRISYLVGMFKALNILYGEALADQWMQRPNSNRIFSGQRPLEYLMRGGLPAFQTVRRLLDARRGGG